VIQSFDQDKPTQVNKNILKNLGMWIGEITLKKNFPLLLSEIDLKDLLINAYFLDKIEYILDFVCFALEKSEGNRVFSLRNPWIKGLLSLLFEIYS